MNLYKKFTRFEKIIFILCLFLIIFSLFKIFYKFFDDYSKKIPKNGGIYSEIIYGKVLSLNPLFYNLNQNDRDIGSFLFRALQKNENGKIIDDLGTLSISEDKKKYTFKIKEGVKWHNGDDFSIDDVFFTYHDILKSPDFENGFLKSAFKNVKIQKELENKISFTLKKPYKFFINNFTIGILPKKIFGEIPVSNILVSERNFENPVGLGPYKIISFERFKNSSKIILEKFQNFYGKKPKIDKLEFNFYENKKDFVKNISTNDGIQASQNQFKTLQSFKKYSFKENKYVGLFLNIEKLSSLKLRNALYYGLEIDKILEDIGENNKIKSPLDLTIRKKDFDLEKSKKILENLGWKIPKEKIIESKKEKEKIIESNSFEPKYFISEKKTFFASSNEKILLKMKKDTNFEKIFVNNKRVYSFGKKSEDFFSIQISLRNGFLKKDKNQKLVIKALDKKGNEKILDIFTIFYTKDEEKLENRKKEIMNLILKNFDETERKKENFKIAQNKKFRINSKNKILKITLLTEKNNEKYGKIADNLKEQWLKLGINLEIHKETFSKLEKSIKNRNYDILLFGQSLGYNSDFFSYWHSSQANENGLNFSNIKNQKIDTSLEKIRDSFSEEIFKQNLKNLENNFQEFKPVFFLYSPTYYYYIKSSVKGVKFNKIKTSIDRFELFNLWHKKETKYLENFSFGLFFDFLIKEVLGN